MMHDDCAYEAIQVPGAVPAVSTQVIQTPGITAILEFSGGERDDHAFARSAAGLRPGEALDDSKMALILDAIRSTDRFRRVAGQLHQGKAVITLEGWPEIRDWTVHWSQGSQKPDLGRELFPGLRKGLRLGEKRLEEYRSRAETLVRESGFPGATLKVRREQGDSRLRFEFNQGAPARIRQVAFEGSPEPYGSSRLLRLMKIHEQKSLWTPAFQREALERIRKQFLKDKRYRGQAELRYTEEGKLYVKLEPGPVVGLAVEGRGLGLKSIKNLVPLARADRYTPELLEEGARRILRHLRGRGYLDAKVEHRETVLEGTREKPKAVKITYYLQAGIRYRLKGIRLERTQEIERAELMEAVGLKKAGVGLWGFRKEPTITPELMESFAKRIEAYYIKRGYSDIAVRQLPFEAYGNQAVLVYQVREGSKRFLDGLDLTVSAACEGLPLAEALTLAFSDKIALEKIDGTSRVYKSDRQENQGITASLEELSTGDDLLKKYALRFSTALLFKKSDIANVLAAIRKRASSQGAVKAQPNLTFEGSKEHLVASIALPAQPSKVSRLIVQGASRTRAEAILRETKLENGMPLDPGALSEAQSNLAGLNAFDRLEMLPMKEEGGDSRWHEGDLLLRIAERPFWNFSAGFGYDKSQGYHFDLSAQRINLGGMGRVLDFGMRAGDSTIRNPTLKRWFPTGTYTRSTDMYRIGYSDPWFAPSFLEGWLPKRTRMNVEAAYIEEQKNLYMLHRRRVQGAFEWKVSSNTLWQTGWRWERSDVKATGNFNIGNQLVLYAKIQDHALLSGPFSQILRDKRDNKLDPTRGTYSLLRLDFANQAFFSSPNASCVKVDARHQWNWPLGDKAAFGVITFGLRAGAVFPTGKYPEDLPLSERLFGGGPGTHRGIEPDSLGVIAYVPPLDASGKPLNAAPVPIPVGGQGLALANLEYRFPVISPWAYGELFVDTGQIYYCLRNLLRKGGDPVPKMEPDPMEHPFPPFRTSLGLGVIFKVGGIPIKVEYAWDAKAIFGKPRTQQERDTRLKHLLFSTAYQF